MKKMGKVRLIKIFLFLLTAFFICSISVVGFPDLDEREYDRVVCKAKDIQRDEASGDITFRLDRDYEGTIKAKNIFRIDKDTIFDERDFLDPVEQEIERFVNGKCTWIGLYTRKEDNWTWGSNKDKEIHVAAVHGFYASVVGFTKDLVPVERLEDMDIRVQRDGDEFNPVGEVSRADAARLVMAIRKDKAAYPDGGFTDVPASHPAYKAICGVRALGFMQGYGGGVFGAEDGITIWQAAKLLVCALGYENLALQYGGYPGGYYAAAEEIGLLEDMMYSSPDSCAKQQDIAQMISNALDIPLMEENRIWNGAELPVKTLYTEYWAAE